MSAELDKARRQIADGDRKGAIKTLWLVEAKARSEVGEAWGLVEAAKRLIGAPETKVQKEAQLLLEHGQAHVARLASSRAAPAQAVRPTDIDQPADVTPLSLGIVLVGAAVMLIAIFLPQFETSSFARIEKNSLVQNGDGWWFIGIAVLAAGTAYRAYRNQRTSFAAVALGAIGIGLAIYYGTAHSQRRLCSVSPLNIGQHCSLATPGIGIYAAGVGGLLMLIGGLQIFRSEAAHVQAPQRGEPRTESPAPAPAPARASALAERLRTLDNLHAGGVITDAEHAQRRAALLDEV